ncbi:MAG: MBG domain-containing protein, partial [Pseudomonadales bacterium]|nr:MBG domain-containing protein [Pseudomonadales bacterium]
NYGVVLEGYLTPTETASYEFYLAADDHAELWLSTDSDPANLVKIANEPQWNGVRSFAGTDRRAKADVDTISVTAPSALDVATTAGGIAAAINAGSSDTSAKVTATSSAGVVTITAAEANSAISIASEVTNGGSDDTQSGVLATTTAAAAGVAQVITYTVSGTIEAGDSLKLTITGPRLETTSPAIALTAGTSYYVRALMKEGGGGDNIAVTWIKSGEAAPANDALPIPGSVLTPASTITYAYSGFVNGEDSSVLTSQPSGSIDASATTPAGEVAIVGTGADAANYAVTHVSGKLTIAPAILTVSGDNKEVFETEALPELTYSISGFLNGEDALVV